MKKMGGLKIGAGCNFVFGIVFKGIQRFHRSPKKIYFNSKLFLIFLCFSGKRNSLGGRGLDFVLKGGFSVTEKSSPNK